MVSFVLIMQFCATVSVQTSASRMLWSFRRDMGVPGWRTLRKVSADTTIRHFHFKGPGLTAEISCTLDLLSPFTASYLPPPAGGFFLSSTSVRPLNQRGWSKCLLPPRPLTSNLSPLHSRNQTPRLQYTRQHRRRTVSLGTLALTWNVRDSGQCICVRLAGHGLVLRFLAD